MYADDVLMDLKNYIRDQIIETQDLQRHLIEDNYKDNFRDDISASVGYEEAMQEILDFIDDAI